MIEREPRHAAPIPRDVARIRRYAPEQLIGRAAELQILDDAWAKARDGEAKRPHVLTFVALGGEGKTSLIAHWVAQLAQTDWPACAAAFAWSFYSQGTRDQNAASSDLFLAEALKFFGVAGMETQSAYEKGRRLAKEIGGRRALLVLDGLEPLQYAPTSPTKGELKDDGIAALLKGLAAHSQGLCLVTTRYSLPDLKAFQATTAPEIALTRLSTEAGVALLRALGVTGAQDECAALVEAVKGHALTLNLMGTHLRDAYAGDIRKRDLFRLAEAKAEEDHGRAFHVMDAYARGLESAGETGARALGMLRLMGLFDRPAEAGCLEALWRKPAIEGLTEPLVDLAAAQRNLVLTRLEEAKLLTVTRDAAVLVAVDAHPLLREYFAARLQKERPEAWRAAHKRLYAHLCATTRDRKPEPTLPDLHPLFQAVAHGCAAEMWQEVCEKVYRDRIMRGAEAYSIHKLGAIGADLGAAACFFATPWRVVQPALSPGAQAWLLNQAGYGLRALGRLGEAAAPLQAGLENYVAGKNWTYAARVASNLCELQLTLGDVAAAIGAGEASVAHADRGGDVFVRLYARTTHADALHQAGRAEKAAALFRAAEAHQAKDQPQYPQLYSLQGFRYSDLLLGPAERAAWRRCAAPAVAPAPASLAACRDVSQRTQQAIQFARRNNWLLDIALDGLMLGRVALYAALLQGAPPFDLAAARAPLGEAMEGLRRAGRLQYLPLGLLSRAMLRALDADPAGAREDLDEAFDIAVRGPMPLFLADIHLHRARLFGRAESYPWESPQADLEEALRLIEKHGYWRRKEELEDAEAALAAAPSSDPR